jgi:hypothetical protein
MPVKLKGDQFALFPTFHIKHTTNARDLTDMRFDLLHNIPSHFEIMVSE